MTVLFPTKMPRMPTDTTINKEILIDVKTASISKILLNLPWSLQLSSASIATVLPPSKHAGWLRQLRQFPWEVVVALLGHSLFAEIM